MQSALGSEHQKSGPSMPCALWPVDLKLTHLDWNPEATLIHFQGQYLTICEFDYNVLQGEIQNIPKTKAAVEIGEFCLVEDFTTCRWYRGRVQNRNKDLFDVFLIDHGNVLSVDIAHISSCSNDLFILPPKVVCGFLANVLLLQGCSPSLVDVYLSNLIGSNVTGYIQALLPHKVLLLEALDINNDLVRHGFGRHVDTDTFILLVGMLTEVPLKQNIEPVPDLLIEKPRGQEFCIKPSGLQTYEDILSFCGPRLSCGTRAKVRVTAAVNPSLFYCQMTSMETELWEMSKKLAAVNELKAKEHNQKTPENLGLLCSVKSKDGKWYRGFIQHLPVNSQLRVLFIDYGFFESVKVESVHRLPPDLYSTPIMAFPCSLSLSDENEAVKTQQLSFLKAGLLGGVLDVEIVHFDEEQHLYTMTVIGAADNHVEELEPIHELPRMNIQSVSQTEELLPQCGYLNCETIMSKVLHQALEAENLDADSVFVGYVEHVQNPNSFWIRTQKRNDEFDDMMSKLADNFSQVKLDENVLLNPEPGTLCCAVYEEDMHFYRGVVTDTLEHGAEVLFIDFGNIEKVPHMLIKKIPEKFASKSAFAFCCTLLNVIPFDDDWSSATSDFFRQAVSNKALLVHVVQMRKNKLIVDLYEMGNDNNQSITELLISSKQAQYWKNITIEPVVQNNANVIEKTRCPRGSVTSDISGNTEPSEEEEKVKEEEKTKEKTCKNQNEKTEVPSSFKALNIKPGCDFAVGCSYIKSPSEFWCQPLDRVPALEELMDKVQRYYSTHTVPLQSGNSYCVAKSPQDEKWYRALITERQNGHARVFLVDYGWSLQIKEHNLQAIMPEYLYLEVQAFRCSLYNLIEPNDPKNYGDWSEEVCKSLKEFALNCTSGLRCTVLSQLNVKNKGLCNAVELYNTQTQQSITTLFLERGLSSKATVSTMQLSTASPESFVYSSYDLGPGNEEQVYITHVSSQWDIYCHLERNTKVIEELEKKISEETEKKMQASTRPVVTKLCLAKYFDGKWYRGFAHPVQSPLHLSVFFVDYGNTNISEKTHVMFIPRDSADLLYTPMQAVRCSLASVSKEKLCAEVKEWLNGAILNKQVRAIIAGKSEDGSFYVELFDGDVNINRKVKEIIASHSPKPKTVVSFEMSSTKTKTRNKTNTKTLVESKSQRERKPSNSSTLNAYRHTHVGSAPSQKKKDMKKDVQGKAKMKKIQVKQHNEDNEKSCGPLKPHRTSQLKQEKEYLEKNTKSAQPKETEIPQLLSLPDLKVSAGFRATCFVSHIDSVNSFFLQLSEDEPAILKMVEDLNSSVLKDSLITPTSLRINDLVVAEYEEDGALYRSAVKDFEGSSCFKVEFVDYGNSAIVGEKKMYSIPKKYLSQPRFSISCSLLDTSRYENDTSFTDAVMNRPLMVDFVHQHGTHWEVKFEILDGPVGLPLALEQAAESSTKTRNEKAGPVISSEVEEKMRFCDEEDFPRKEVSENETTQSKRMTPQVDGENLMLKTSAATLSPKLEAHRTSTRNMDDIEDERKTSKSSVKAMSDWADEILPQIIQTKDTKKVTVLSVLTNGNFYTRLKETSELLAALESCIADNLYKCKMVAKEDLKEGLKCLVQEHKHKQWYRAVVQRVGQEKCQVLLMDHGIKEEISSSSIRQQCSELTKIPHFAVLCKVNCLGFSEGVGAEELWCETLKPMIGKELKLVFVCYSEADKLWKVEIVINELFLTRQITTLLQQNEEMILPSSETRTQKAKEQSNLDTSTPQQLDFAPVDTDKAYSGFAAAVTTPFEFCVVLEDLLLVMNKVSIMLDDLPGQMPPLPEAHLVPNTCCLLKSDTKNKWCRAEIVHINNTAVFNLVDYGHHECISYKDCAQLKRLPEEMTNLPKVTYPCILRGVKPVGEDGQWTDEAAVFFQQCLCQKNLQIFFREFVSNTHWKVDILADGIHVAKELVDAGHGNYMDIMLGLRFQEQSPHKAVRLHPDSEEECGQEDEDSDRKSQLSFEAPDKVEKMLLSTVSGTRQCLLM